MDKIAEVWGSIPQGVQWALAGIGALYAAKGVSSILQFVLHTFLLSGTNLRKYGGKGTWAVVTGASDGLGKEFSLQLAAKGFNIVLVSRTKSKLDALAQEIESKYAGVQTKTLAMDFSQDKAEDYDRLKELLKGLDVGILINNVGQSHDIPTPFLETDPAEIQSIVTINCLGTLKVTQAVAPLLTQRKKGLILTMGSFAGVTPTPLLATYSGTKAFLQHWNSALAEELRPQGVDSYLLVSYLVTTAMSKVRRTSLLIPNPKQFVRAALGKIGLCGSELFPYTYTPFWSHNVFRWVVAKTVGSYSRFTIWYNLGMHQQIRNRALKKAAREAKKQ
ncbi:3-ketoacyl-coa reductase [Naviculisporaceae sp. PSN 640]